MNKFSLLSLLSIALSTTSLSLSAIKLGDKIEIGDGFDSVRAKSSDIAITQQYGGFPKVPLVHPYHALKVQPLVVFSGRFPAKVLSMSGDVAEGIKGAMATTRVTPEDPFFVVVQPYIYENTDKEKKLEKTNQLLRPQYVYTENVDKESTKPYSEGGMELTLSKKMIVTYEAVSAFEKKLAERVAQVEGYLDGWGVLS